MIARKILFLDSSKATNVDLTAGYARFEYPQPIEASIGPVKLALSTFSYTNFFVNVEAPNNVIYLSDDVAAPLKYTITIPTGSYGLTDINDYVQGAQLSQTGVAVFSLQPNYSTGHVSVVFGNVTGWYVNFTANAPPVLGFGVQHVPATNSNTAYYTEEAASGATFNNITAVKVSTDLSQSSIDNSSLSSSIIHVSTPSVSIGSVQVDQPLHLLTIDSIKLTTTISNITIQILDQLNRPLKLSEHFTLVLMVI